ncbi:hypothetical protein [Paenibacillus macerans]|uniref:hypothetical protein n=1 Tax=Paenibacillus macerans TaxID=44252 RepID=UPI00203B35AC|nr:hypothetical protein [Paenibacillus macerans]MCM3703794.1 hypothetical protein [Paenibacillus macerans]
MASPMQKVSSLVSANLGDTLSNIKNWGGLFYNAADYGIVPGIDVTEKLQELVNLANSEGRTTIVFLPGDYYVTSIINDEKIVYFGDGAKFIGGYGRTINSFIDYLSIESLIKDLFVASWHGVNSSIGTADATNALNSLFTAAKANGKRYVYFDQPHTYNVSGDLTGARDLILLGCGARIKSYNLKNYFIQIGDNLSSFNGKYNLYPETDLLFKTVALALQNKTINVTVWGDSLLTGGSDIIGIKYNTNHTGTTEQSPNGLTPADSQYLRLVDMLTAKFPNVTFNFYNRAIGGKAIQSSEDVVTFNGVSKPWSEHIKDTNPDLLIIGFGMNTNLSLGVTFRFCMDRITNYINANYTKKPSVCWVTTPRPTMALEDEWGTYDSQLSRHLAAYTTRYAGRLLGGYVIDANRVSDLLRTGVDYSNPIMERADLTGLISGTYSESGGIYTMDADGEYILLDVQASDFTLEFDINFQSPDGNLWFGYNRIGTLETVALFYPSFSGVGAIQNYANYLDAAHYSTTAGHSDTVSWADSTWRTVRVEKRSDVVNIFVNGVRFIRDLVAINNLPGHIVMRMNGTRSAVYQLRNFRFYKGTYKNYTPSLLEKEMWGNHVDGDYDTKSPYGGNGVNHPSTVGLENVYVTVLKEFIDDIAANRWKYLIVG